MRSSAAGNAGEKRRELRFCVQVRPEIKRFFFISVLMQKVQVSTIEIKIAKKKKGHIFRSHRLIPRGGFVRLEPSPKFLNYQIYSIYIRNILHFCIKNIKITILRYYKLLGKPRSNNFSSIIRSFPEKC